MSNLNILFVASEIEGLAKTGGLADVAKSLPKSLQGKGHDVHVVVPCYRSITGSFDAPVVLDTALLADNDTYIDYQVRELETDGVKVWAIDCRRYFDRESLYAENNQAYHDNGERFAFLSVASLDLTEKLNFRPDIVHANDWHTGLVPFLLKNRYQHNEFFADTRSVISIHNAVFKGVFSYAELKLIPELTRERFAHIEIDHHHIAFLKAGVAYADKINGVSPNYAKELLTDLGSQGMGWDFSARANDLVGIVNGCDYGDWNPEIDELIPQKFKANKTSMTRGKKACKKALQAEVSLPQKDLPMFGMVCRLTEQKGLQYLVPILRQFLLNDVQVVIVGTGDPAIAHQLNEIATEYKEKFAFVEAYSNKLAHWVEASADVFLMPSEFEPCGLNQMYSMVYGTLPLVRNVGGLKDTVIDYDANPEFATGFIFESPEPSALLIAMQRALLLHAQNPVEFKRVQMNAMSCRFDWDDSAQQYLDLYASARVGIQQGQTA
ncbi:glycogen synthase GlgA [Veronia nyctiphanis]|uniref:Glycogen synthase n=1 Tax=Veronia nyctiphanis TaxID=1278244 RepID=A0A4Q0YMV9_9GAMM|nr:glycogen synthase GlgA [Veronia nyctiphanis]RXJ72242.1 glycogen synthase GlgA [Veronia nyctiphanis]